MIKEYAKNEASEQHMVRPATDKPKSTWHSPHLTVLKGSNTEAGSGNGLDGGTVGSSLS